MGYYAYHQYASRARLLLSRHASHELPWAHAMLTIFMHRATGIAMVAQLINRAGEL